MEEEDELSAEDIVVIEEEEYAYAEGEEGKKSEEDEDNEQYEKEENETVRVTANEGDIKDKLAKVLQSNAPNPGRSDGKSKRKEQVVKAGKGEGTREQGGAKNTARETGKGEEAETEELPEHREEHKKRRILTHDRATSTTLLGLVIEKDQTLLKSLHEENLKLRKELEELKAKERVETESDGPSNSDKAEESSLPQFPSLGSIESRTLERRASALPMKQAPKTAAKSRTITCLVSGEVDFGAVFESYSGNDSTTKKTTSGSGRYSTTLLDDKGKEFVLEFWDISFSKIRKDMYPLGNLMLYCYTSEDITTLNRYLEEVKPFCTMNNSEFPVMLLAVKSEPGEASAEVQRTVVDVVNLMQAIHVEYIMDESPHSRKALQEGLKRAIAMVLLRERTGKVRPNSIRMLRSPVESPSPSARTPSSSSQPRENGKKCCVIL